jgi:hypothetical protein
MLGRSSSVASAGPSSIASSVPSLVGGGRGASAARMSLLRQQQHARRAAGGVARATVRSAVTSHPRLASSLDALESIKASAVNRYAQDTKSCIISIGLTSESASPIWDCPRGCGGGGGRPGGQRGLPTHSLSGRLHSLAPARHTCGPQLGRGTVPRTGPGSERRVDLWIVMRWSGAPGAPQSWRQAAIRLDFCPSPSPSPLLSPTRRGARKPPLPRRADHAGSIWATHRCPQRHSGAHSPPARAPISFFF